MKKNNISPLWAGSSMSDILIKEDFLHYIWKYKIFASSELILESGERLLILDSGKHNFDAGPDFLNSIIKIDEQLWAGNVEMHLKASDWYVHQHQKDENYDAVVLHVVWENDVPVLDKNGIEYPTLVLRDNIQKESLVNYTDLMSKNKNWILCEEDIVHVDSFTKESWLSRLYFERLENKSVLIHELLSTVANDWEQVLFLMLLKNFGLKLNGEAFLNLGNSFDFSILRKQQNVNKGLECLLFGQAGFLEAEIDDMHFVELKNEYRFLQKKYKLTPLFNSQFKFFRLRPFNFPTIRIAQFSTLYEEQKNLFSQMMKISTLQEFYDLFEVESSEYWDTHYTFGKVSKKRKKKISKAFIDLLLINTIIPIKYAYLRFLGTYEFDELETLLRSIKAESNSIIENFSNLSLNATSAFDSQAMLELKNKYCDKQRCLNCAIGLKILK